MEFVIGFAVAGLIGLLIADSKGRDKAEGCALGCLLGPIGWLIEAFLPAQEGDDKASATASQKVSAPASNSTSQQDARPREKCPYCAELILVEAKVCKHCGRDVDLEESGTEELETGEKFCPACDALLGADREECPECGYDAGPLSD